MYKKTENNDGLTELSEERKQSILSAISNSFENYGAELTYKFYRYDEGDSFYVEVFSGYKGLKNNELYRVYSKKGFEKADYLPNDCSPITKPAFVEGVSKMTGLEDFEVDDILSGIRLKLKQASKT